MERLIKITNQTKQAGDADTGPAEAAIGFHICKVCNHMWKVRKSTPNPKSCPSCHSTIWNSATARKIECQRCGYVWTTNIPHPTMCPSCKSRTYDAETILVSCRKCGMRWEDRMNRPDIVCPTCGPVSRDGVKIIPRTESPETAEVRKSDRGTPPIDATDLKMLSEMRDDGSRTIYLSKIGFDPMEADILVRYIGGQKPVGIAIELDVPLGTVFEIVIPYIEATEVR